MTDKESIIRAMCGCSHKMPDALRADFLWLTLLMERNITRPNEWRKGRRVRNGEWLRVATDEIAKLAIKHPQHADDLRLCIGYIRKFRHWEE